MKFPTKYEVEELRVNGIYPYSVSSIRFFQLGLFLLLIKFFINKIDFRNFWRVDYSNPISYYSGETLSLLAYVIIFFLLSFIILSIVELLKSRFLIGFFYAEKRGVFYFKPWLKVVISLSLIIILLLTAYLSYEIIITFNYRFNSRFMQSLIVSRGGDPTINISNYLNLGIIISFLLGISTYFVTFLGFYINHMKSSNN